MAILTIRNSSCVIPPIKYGLLYNWYNINDSRELTSSVSWYVPSLTEYRELADYLGAGGSYSTNTVGGKLKETGTTYWDSPNEGATNEYGFNGRGGGNRSHLASFASFRTQGQHWTSTNQYLTETAFFAYLNNSNESFNVNSYTDSGSGKSIRLVSDATGVADGTTTVYVGNDLKAYSAIAINGLYWLQYSLAETEYRDGTPIPEVTDNTAWAALTTGALCAYNNDWNNV